MTTSSGCAAASRTASPALGDHLTLHSRAADRTSTLFLTLRDRLPVDAYEFLAKRDVLVPAGTFYAYETFRALDLPVDAGLRIGLAAYNDDAEVDRLLEGLTELLRLTSVRPGAGARHEADPPVEPGRSGVVVVAAGADEPLRRAEPPGGGEGGDRGGCGQAAPAVLGDAAHGLDQRDAGRRVPPHAAGRHPLARIGHDHVVQLRRGRERVAISRR